VGVAGNRTRVPAKGLPERVWPARQEVTPPPPGKADNPFFPKENEQKVISPEPTARESRRVMSWYYSINGRQNGPVTDDGIRQLQRDGYLPRATLFWQVGLSNWVGWEEFLSITGNEPVFDIVDYAREKGYKVPKAVGEVAVNDDFWADEILAQGGTSCSRCGGNFPLEEFVEVDGKRICITCEKLIIQTVVTEKKKTTKIMDKKKTVKIEDRKKTVKIERIALQNVARARTAKSPMDLLGHQLATPEEMRLAEEFEVELPGLGQRITAKIVDWVPSLLIAGGVFGLLSGSQDLSEPLKVLITLLVFLSCNVLVTLLSCLVARETPGKLLMKLRVIDADGDPAGWQRQASRAAIEQLGLVAVFFGYAAALTNDMRLCMHDQVCQTIVAKK
jgi:uncharacterized RDD family membrane protein YckC